MLPKAVESTVVERRSSQAFRLGVCEMNGWRKNMEDAHVIITKPDWGFFGIFDGHGGDQCSAFVSERLEEEIRKGGCPKDDAAVQKLIFETDAAFLATEKASGSTATMCIVHKSAAGGKCRIRVANAGDSRILLGTRDGKIIDGGGTEKGLTTDHKPSHPSERQRIYRCGGTVEEAAGGVARVNGELAVSRGFGDAEHKKTGGPGPEERPVTCNPEFGHFECDESDFLMLVCDGVSEGEFPNPEVVKHAAAIMRETDDPGAAAEAVCFKALETNSKDNISVMIVLLKGAERDLKDVTFKPGPLTSINHAGFMEAYEYMAKKAGLTLAQAAEMRYDMIMDQLASPEATAAKEALREEAEKLGQPAGSKGSAERAAWWRNWEQKLPEQQKNDDEGAGGDPDAMLMRMLMARSGMDVSQLMGMLNGRDEQQEDGRKVRVPGLAVLKQAVNTSPALQWDSRLAALPGQEGIVKVDDSSDGTSQVRFPPPIGVVAWLPTSALIAVKDDVSIPAAGYSAANRRSARQGGATGSETQRPLLPRLGQRSVGGSTMGRGGSPNTPTPANKAASGSAAAILAKANAQKPRFT